MATPKHKRPDDCHTNDRTPCCWEANATLQPSSFTGCGCALSRGWGVGQGRKPHTSPESRGDRKWVHDTLPGDRGWIGNGQIETAHKPPMLLCSGKITSLLPRLLGFNLVQSCVACVGTSKVVRSQHGTKSPQQLVYPCCCLMKPGAPIYSIQFSSVQFSSSVMSNSLRPHELQHARPPCPSPTPRVYSNPCPLSQWCHPTISSSVAPFSSCPQSFPASGSFQMSQLFTSGGQSIGVSASTSVPPMKHPGLISFRMDWLDLLAIQGTLKCLLQHHSSKASILRCSAFFIVQLSHL